MSETRDQPQTAPPVPGAPRILTLQASVGVCFLGWLLPGLSHLVLGRWGRGLAFAAAVLAMFALGLGMHGHLYPMAPEAPLHLFAFIANVGVGLPYAVAQNMGLGAGNLSNPSYDYGNAYLWVAGLLNYLIVLDAFDIAQGRKP